MKRKILVLGSSGCLGTSLEKIIKSENIFSYKGYTHKDVELTNTRNLTKMINKFKPSVIINTVALILINYCEQNPEKTMKVNAFSVFELAKICKSKNITLVQISTHAVFDGEMRRPYNEKDKPNPINIYAYSKLISEYFVKLNLKKYFIFRCPTMYGPRRNKSLGFADKMIIKMQKGETLKIAHDRMDSPSYALNISKKLIKIIKGRKYGTYHLSDHGYVSYYNFIKQLGKEIGFKGKILKAKHNSFPALAPNPLRAAMTSLKGGTGVIWKKALKMYVKDENIKC